LRVALTVEAKSYEDDDARPTRPSDRIECLLGPTGIHEHLHIGAASNEELEPGSHDGERIDQHDAHSTLDGRFV
jgi:hypothetical protein